MALAGVVRRIVGRRIRLRDVEVSDAELILHLRLNFGQKISPTDPDPAKQVVLLQKYKADPGSQYYFIIEDADGAHQYGCVRIYDLKPDSFCWGSWIISPDAPVRAALESAQLIYEFGFYRLGFPGSHFDVRKNNPRVVRFHQTFGARIVAEDELNFYFRFSRGEYEQSRLKYAGPARG